MDACLERDVLMKSARLLGIARGDVLLFDTEDETSVLMDFALNDVKVKNKNIIEIYREKIGWKNTVEKKILDARRSSYTSLFRIKSISEENCTLVVSDILNKKDNIKLIDIAFSQTGVPGLLLFFRLVPFKDFNMTSGVSFVFPGDSERDLLMRYKKLRKKKKSEDESIRRFISFFKLNKKYGLEVLYM